MNIEKKLFYYPLYIITQIKSAILQMFCFIATNNILQNFNYLVKVFFLVSLIEINRKIV